MELQDVFQPLVDQIKIALQDLAKSKGRAMRLNSILRAVNFLSEFTGEVVPFNPNLADDLANEIGSKIRAYCLPIINKFNYYPPKKDIAEYILSLDSSIVDQS